jgi:hypothetical protein
MWRFMIVLCFYSFFWALRRDHKAPLPPCKLKGADVHGFSGPPTRPPMPPKAMPARGGRAASPALCAARPAGGIMPARLTISLS